MPGGQGGVALVRGRFENDRLQDVEDVFFVEPWNSADSLADLGAPLRRPGCCLRPMEHCS
jgi:hypothetical protein